MSYNFFRGDAQDVAQVATHTVGGTAANGQVYTVTINLKEVAYTATGADTNTTIATALTALLAASSIPEFQEASWSSDGAVITSTSAEDGVPYTATTSATGTGTFVTATTTAATGKRFWDNADNWSLGRVPAGQLIAPVQSAAVAIAGGSLSNGTTYYWVITATNALGETVVSNERSLAITNPNNTATLAWAAVSQATGYKIYRSTSAGTYGATSLVTTITSGSTLTYNDTGAALSAGTPPGASTALGDDVIFRDCSTDLSYNIDQSTLVLNSLAFEATYTGLAGFNEFNGSYYQYRACYLKLQLVTGGALNIGKNGNTGSAGSGRLKLDLNGSSAIVITVESTGSPADTGLPALIMKGYAGNSTINAQQGTIGIALVAGDTAAHSVISTSFINSAQTDVTVILGAGATHTTLNVEGGIIDTQSAITTLTMTDGTVTFRGTAAMTTGNVRGGTLYYQSSGTCTTMKVWPGGTLDMRRDMRARTFTNMTLEARSAFYDTYKTVTFTNPFLINCPLDQLSALDLGSAFSVQRS